jgi:hypothetical protein
MALKVGNEAKWKVYLASGLGVAVLGVLAYEWNSFFPSSSPTAPPPTVVTAPRPTVPSAGSEGSSASPNARTAVKVSGLAALDPTLHPEIMRQAESLAYTGNGRNIFSQFSAPPAIPQPIAPIRNANVNPGPPPPPPPPPITLGFYGYAAEKTGQKQVFLLHGDDIFIASEGDVVDRRYRVVKIGTASVQVEDIPYHNTQTLPLRQ